MSAKCPGWLLAALFWIFGGLCAVRAGGGGRGDGQAGQVTGSGHLTAGHSGAWAGGGQLFAHPTGDESGDEAPPLQHRP